MHRGSSVSIGLAFQNQPVFGVVYAYTFPNDQGDLISGGHPDFGPLKRNHTPLTRSSFPFSLEGAIVALSQDGDRCSLTNSQLCAPARWIAIPSIAYRLALVAVGDVDIGISLASPNRLDWWAGLALLKCVGGTLVSSKGEEMTIESEWSHGGRAIFGSSLHLAQALARREWMRVFTERNPPLDSSYDLLSPQLKTTYSEDYNGILGRAQGVFLGQCTGDALGSLVEFQSPNSIQNQYPQGVTQLHDGGTFNTLAGQATDDTEMALTLARSIIHKGHYSKGAAALGYGIWLQSNPFDLGNTTSTALRPVVRQINCFKDSFFKWGNKEEQKCAQVALEHASQLSQANGALMRVSPLAIFGTHCSLDQVASWARQDAALTHPHSVCQEANAIYCVALVLGIRDRLTPVDLYNATLKWAKENALNSEVIHWLEDAKQEILPMYPHQIGWVKRAFQGAFYLLLHSTSLADGVQKVVQMGGDTDTNGAIVGALLGSVYGIEGVPRSWMTAILSNRPQSQLPWVKQPRPRSYWTCDVLQITEQLLSLGDQYT